MSNEFLLTKDPFYESDVFGTIATEAGIDAYLDSEGEINSRYRDSEGNIRAYTPRLILDSGGPRANVVQEVQTGYMMKDRLLRPALVAVSKKTIKSEKKDEILKNDEKNNEN